MLKAMTVVAMVLLLGGCAEGRDARSASGLTETVCAPDGSVVFVTVSNSERKFDTAKASAANCPWNKKTQ